MISKEPVPDRINRFLDEVDYSHITTIRDEMEAKLQKWANLYKELIEKDKTEHIELKNEMKELMKAYGFDNDYAKNIFISKLLNRGIEEKRAEEIANELIKEVKEYYNIQL